MERIHAPGRAFTPVRDPPYPGGVASPGPSGRTISTQSTQRPCFQPIAGSSPVLLLMAPQNGTGEPFSTQPMAVAMIQRIQANSGFRFADPGQVAAITGQLEYQQGGMNPASLVRLGRQTGAGYMLYGDLVSEGSRYRLAMSLMDLKSGELLWNASRSAAR